MSKTNKGPSSTTLAWLTFFGHLVALVSAVVQVVLHFW